MEIQHKESYTEPVLMMHQLLRDITGVTSGAVKTQIEKSGPEAT